MLVSLHVMPAALGTLPDNYISTSCYYAAKGIRMKQLVITLIITLLLPCTSVYAHHWCWCCNQDNTYGWQLMTPDERKEHQAKIVSFSTYGACREYSEAHHKKMEERAHEKRVDLPGVAVDPCDWMRDNAIFK